MADNGDMQLVAVVLEDQGDVYVDTRAMFDYVYANFSKVFLNEHDKPDGVRKFKTEDAYVVLPKGIDVSSLEHEITITDRQNAAGKLTYFAFGKFQHFNLLQHATDSFFVMNAFEFCHVIYKVKYRKRGVHGKFLWQISNSCSDLISLFHGIKTANADCAC